MGMTHLYKQIIRKELEEYENTRIDNAPDVKFHLIINEDQTEFILLSIGWNGKKYRHGVIFHIQLKDDKVWLYKNNTDIEIGEVFAREGIPKSKIVIAWLPSYMQEVSEYGVG